MPESANPLPESAHRGSAPRPLVIGHRGAPGYRPEHTEASYRLACELGADAVEPDLVATRDGVIVIRHENEISGTTNVADHPEFASRKTTKVVDGVRLTGWFTEDFTWDELSRLRCLERLSRLRADNRRFDREQPILRLRDVLAIVDEESARLGRTIDVVLELKHAHYFDGLGLPLDTLMRAEIAAAGWEGCASRCIIESFELGILDRLRAAGAEETLIFLIEREGAPADEVARLGRDAKPFSWYRTDAGLTSLVGRVAGISVAKSDLFQPGPSRGEIGVNDLVERAHDRGLVVYTWTLRPERAFLDPAFGGRAKRAEWGAWQDEFGLIIDSGVDGIFVDHPDLGVSARFAQAGVL